MRGFENIVSNPKRSQAEHLEAGAIPIHVRGQLLCAKVVVWKKVDQQELPVATQCGGDECLLRIRTPKSFENGLRHDPARERVGGHALFFPSDAGFFGALQKKQSHRDISDFFKSDGLNRLLEGGHLGSSRIVA